MFKDGPLSPEVEFGEDSGAARWSEGYNALEVGVRERRDWHKLPTTMRRLRHVVSLL